MGYKSVVRSMNAAANRSAREREKIDRARQREYERQLKKIQKIEDKQQSIFAELKKVYAAGKIEKPEYTLLKLREKDIDLASIAVGGTPYATLAKRYITGKIDKSEFDCLILEVLPADFIEEKNLIDAQISDKQKEYKRFVSKCQFADGCKYCGKKGFFRFLGEYKNKTLCLSHRKELKQICTYSHYGTYFTVDPQDVIEIEKGHRSLNLQFNIISIN